MNNSIKIGDTVRVSKDAPTIYNKGWLHDWCNTDSVVKEIDKEDAVIASILRKNDELAIPTKYLVKVGAEKEAKFKLGDKVRIKGGGYAAMLHKGDIGEILDINDKEQCFVLFKKTQAWIYFDCLEPYAEPQDEKPKPEEKVKTKGDTLVFPVSLDLQGSYWQVYEADLAKEIVLKVANKYNDPKEAAEYAINVAEAVVEGLKRK